MSIVRYLNKKTGKVILYESTSHYDPVTKQSRPIRKYLGVEDPETGELIPSTGIPGRRPGPGKEKKKNDEESKIKLLTERYKVEIKEKDTRIKELERENTVLKANLERIREIVNNMLKE